MKDEARKWLGYADENLASGELLLDRGLFNPCLQNVQQAVEKTLKAILLECSGKFKRTHSINELAAMIQEEGVIPELSEDDCDLLDSIYLPSKYPLGGVLPEFEPNREVCERCLAIARRVRKGVKVD